MTSLHDDASRPSQPRGGSAPGSGPRTAARVVDLDECNSSETPTIAMVRHGQTDWNAAGKLQGQVQTDLNATGREQALEAAAKLKGGHWDRVVTSPLGRAFQTGEIIARQLGLPAPTVDDGLMERAYGDYEGVRDEDLSEETRSFLHPDHSQDPGPLEEEGFRRGLLPGVEHSHHVGERGADALRRIAAAYPGQRIIVVAHGTIIRLTLDALDEWQRFHPSPKNAEILPLSREQWARVAGTTPAG